MDARRRSRTAFILFVAALAVGAYAYSLGQLAVSILVVFPLVSGRGPWALLAMALFFAAFITYASAAFARRPDMMEQGAPEDAREGIDSEAYSRSARKNQSSGIVLIGPIPIVWGKDARTVVILAVIAIALTLTVMWLTYAGPFTR